MGVDAPDSKAVFINVPFASSYEPLSRSQSNEHTSSLQYAVRAGLACALKLAAPSAYEVFVLDSHPYRIDKTLSDFKGRDPLIHGGTCDGMIACLLDTFTADVADTAAQFRSAARVLRKSAQLLKFQMKTESLFRPALFRLIVAAATEIAIDRNFIRP